MPGQHLLKEFIRFCARFGLQRDSAGPFARVGKFTPAHRYSSPQTSHAKYRVWVWSDVPAPSLSRRKGGASRELDFVVLEGAAIEPQARSRYFVLEQPHVEWLRRRLEETRRQPRRKTKQQLSVNIGQLQRFRQGEAKVGERVEFIAGREIRSEQALKTWFQGLQAGRFLPPPYR